MKTSDTVTPVAGVHFADYLTRFRFAISIPFFLIFGYIIISTLSDKQAQLEQNYHDSYIANLRTGYEQVVIAYERSSIIIFDEVINRPEVLSLMSRALDANEAEQAAIRQTLYDNLLETYRRLEEINLRQLHFHLPDNRSFLRFHQPDRFGDDLTNYRYTVMVTNRDLVPTTGFEEGRIFNGFRYVFPLFYEGQHVGSVETSNSFTAIQEDLNRSLPGTTSFVLRSDVVEAIVFDDLQSNYVISDFSTIYAYDRAVTQAHVDQDISWGVIQRINGELSAQDIAHVEDGITFSTDVRLDGVNYIVTFLGIDSVQGEHVGYIISYVMSDIIAESRENFLINQIAIIAIALGGMVFSVYLDRSSRFISQQRQQLAQQNRSLKTTNLSLQESELKYRALLSVIPDMMFRSDRNGIFLDYYTDSIANLLVPPEQFIGRNIADILPAEIAESHMICVREALQTGQQVTHEYTLLIDDRLLHFEARIVASGQDEVLAIVRDLTDSKQAQKRKMQISLERERRKILRQFIEKTSHEFRTPLSIINSNIYMLKRTDDPNQREVFALRTENQTRLIADLVDTLLEIIRLDTGDGNDDMKSVNLNYLLVAIHDEMNDLADRANITTEVPDDLPTVFGNESQLYAMLRHILHNARRYTAPNGNVTVRARVEDNKMIVEIEDDGDGISADDLPYVFDTFWRKDSAHSTPGLGLGLSSAQKIAHLHHGDINISSQLGRGTCVTITLPLVQPENNMH